MKEFSHFPDLLLTYGSVGPFVTHQIVLLLLEPPRDSGPFRPLGPLRPYKPPGFSTPHGLLERPRPLDHLDLLDPYNLLDPSDLLQPITHRYTTASQFWIFCIQNFPKWHMTPIWNCFHNWIPVS